MAPKARREDKSGTETAHILHYITAVDGGRASDREKRADKLCQTRWTFVGGEGVFQGEEPF